MSCPLILKYIRRIFLYFCEYNDSFPNTPFYFLYLLLIRYKIKERDNKVAIYERNGLEKCPALSNSMYVF